MKRAGKHPILQTGSGSLPSLPVHRNPGLEIVNLVRGSVKWQTENRLEEVSAGSVFFTFPWEAHGGIEEFERGHFWQFAIFQVREGGGGRGKTISFPESFGFSEVEGKRIARTLLSARRRSWPTGRFLSELFDELIAETKTKPTQSSGGKLSALARLIVLELSRIVKRADLEVRARPGPQSVGQFLKILASRCEEPWTLAKMAQKSGYQRTHLADQIRHLTGDSPICHLKRLRVERARTLLRTTEKTITEIAHLCGFSTSQHFARIFRQFTLLSASEFRRRAPPPCGS